MADALRAKQRPLKDNYRVDPSSALVTLRSSGTLDASSITCKLSTGAAIRDAKAKLSSDAHSHSCSRDHDHDHNHDHSHSHDNGNDGPQKVAGLHQMAGGDDPTLSGELCSGDMLLEALVACAGVTLKAVATALGIPIKSGVVRAEGDLDFRGTMGVDKEAPVGFTDIRLGFELKTAEEVDDDKIERLGKLTERYCVVLQTLVHKPKLTVRLAGGAETEDGVDRGFVWGQKL
ncbi:hypothetical protein W97_03762 [Coniosporium apollinis CBS 100218]|uniref:OsmC family protein n=1 Tax=Coniosporium apollinis (strain CBS 100218) TaxID=1168221 RepID=R7YRT0_CONA1|nr:uncharacterized protein W97_03762 [Coniosporium apollinis CBS 100218]EON64529.1 hypothetical protein W97_03762 [Coniosporium apollinis CBS 100218]